jgi:2-polyprenyl-6-methoxyphenol hydroxylase-like FAD-dependent oxidoreductase
MSWRDRWNRAVDDDCVIVVGAGVTGLAAALALQHAGHRVVVLEQLRAAGQDVRAIVLSAHDAELLDAHGLAGDVLRESVPFRETIVDLGSPTPVPPMRTAASPWPRVMPRSILAALLEREAYWAGVRLVYGTKVAAARTVRGAAHVTTADGHQLAAATLIGADGPDSTVRQGFLNSSRRQGEPVDDGGTRAETWALAGTTVLSAVAVQYRRALEAGATLTYADGHRWFFAQITDPAEDALTWMARYRPSPTSGQPAAQPKSTVETLRAWPGMPAVAEHIIERSDAVRVRQTRSLPPSLLSLPSSVRLLGSARDGGHRTSDHMGAHALSEALSTPSRH